MAAPMLTMPPSSSDGVGDMWIPLMPSPPPTPAPPEASLSTQERLRLAKRRRAAQLKRWAQREVKGGGGGSGHSASSALQPDLIQGLGAGAGGSASPELASVGVYSSSNVKKATKLKASSASAAPLNRPGRVLNSSGRGISFVANVMLLEAAARNDVEEVRRLLEMGVSPDSTNEDGLTALHQCCIDDSEEMMQVLIGYGGNANATDTEKWTPLHAAATCGHLHLVKFLIDSGADLLAVNADGNMPYDLCEDDTTLSYIENEMAKRGVTQDLIDSTRAQTERQMLFDLQNASSDYLEFRDVHGATPLHVAAANGYLSVVEYLLDNHVSTEVVDDDMWQPIHAAACWGHLEVVEMLAQNGANISAKTKNGETPFDICEDPEIKERLIQLKEQRVRLEQPRVRRSRSASTRTQSIRRTSLREKMNTTKKDVQDEKLYFIQSFDAMPKIDTNATGSLSKPPPPPPDHYDHSSNGNDDIVDINDVELTLAPSYFGSDGSASGMPPPPPMPKADYDRPQRPPRSTRDLVFDTSSSSSPVQSSSKPSASSTSSNPAAVEGDPAADKINIHVSVTINQSPAAAAAAAANSSSSAASPTSGTTLADLKKARSMSRATSANLQSNSFPESDPAAAATGGRTPQNPPPLPPHHHSHSQQQQQQQQQQHPSARQEVSSPSPAAGSKFQRFSAPEVVGPTPKKKGCCAIL